MHTIDLQAFQGRSLKKQQGVSALFILVFLGLLALALLVSFKLYPAYYEHWQIESVIESFEEEKDLADLSVKEVIKRFQLRLQTNNVRNFDFDDSVFIDMEDGVLSIELDYEVRQNVYRNVDAVVIFKKQVEIKY